MIRAERAISIHAPAKGATQSGDHGSGGNAISIHAPAKGATPKAETGYKPCQYFNPRSREGSDRLNRLHLPDYPISIHAPAKGATHRIRDLQRKDRFQSTLPRRERHRLHLIKRSDMNFNPRSREGSDVAALAICDANTNFNPRSREGSDGVLR